MIISESTKVDLLSYINFANRIFSIKNKIGKYREGELLELMRDVNQSRLFGKSWLLKEIEELEKNVA